jgi:arylsulfatase A-like enzyme
MKPHQVQAERDAYEAAIAYLDQQVGALSDSLEARALLDNTVFIVTSDHGELFGEHGEFTHGQRLYIQALHIPLLIRAPGLVPAGRRIDDFVTLRDLAATILDLTTKSDDLPGRSLARFWSSSGTTDSRPESPVISSISNARWSAASPPSVLRGTRSIVRDGMLIIEDVHGKKRTELFDLRHDPRGERDLAADSAWSGTLAAGRAALAPLLWRSQARGVARKAGDIGAIQQ